MSATLALTKDLISRPSVTPEDFGCQELLASRLAPLGFNCETLQFEDVINLWAVHGKGDGPLLVLLGHTDVVPTGDEKTWKYPPFVPTEEGDLLYGRGTADMKGSVAAMTVAMERFVQDHPEHKGQLALMMTADEEGPSINGVRKVVPALSERGVKIDYCLVGEPSSVKRTGDMVKNGRRGSLCATIRVNGQQGHVAYPHLADNPFHQVAPALAELCAIEWDKGNDFFPPTSFQVSNINAGTGAENVIPGTLDLLCNFRYCTENTAEGLKQRFTEVMAKHKVNYDIEWRLSGEPFLTPKGALLEAAQTAIKEVTGIDTELSTSGGTSDGRFVAPTGAQVLELGPLNATIHQIDECVSISDLNALEDIYYRIMVKLLA